jgi:4'-phosphopantetheinyl transferase
VIPAPRGEVHVWRAPLSISDPERADLLATLSPDERARADRFHFDRDRAHFIAGRGFLRAILGAYLDVAPRALVFDYSPHGKPRLATGAGGLRFNLSHSHDLALCAVALDRELGVDVEYIQPRLEEGIAERFFSRREVAALRSLPAEAQSAAFFACWTRKEAYVKAHGQGLSLRLDRFDVSLAPGEPAALLRTEDDPAEAMRWSLRELVPGPGYAGALAAEGQTWRLRCWQWLSARARG